jgi:hypothetical protein
MLRRPGRRIRVPARHENGYAYGYHRLPQPVCEALEASYTLYPSQPRYFDKRLDVPSACSRSHVPQPPLRSKTKHSSAQQQEAAVRYKTCKKLLLPFGPYSIASCGCAAPVEDNRGHPDYDGHHPMPLPGSQLLTLHPQPFHRHHPSLAQPPGFNICRHIRATS